MRYIKSFENDAAIQSAVDDGVLGHPYVALDDQTHKIDWDGKELSPIYQYFTIEALEDGDFHVDKNLYYYSKNKGPWTKTYHGNLNLLKGDMVRFKGDISWWTGQNGMFSGNTIQFKVFGNIESLEYMDDFVGKTAILGRGNYDGAFTGLFLNSTGLIDASNLILPATTLQMGCYSSMFSNCASLEKAPELPAINLTTECYKYMFKNCSKINYVKCLGEGFYPSQGYTSSWLDGVSGTGTLVKSSNMPIVNSNTSVGWRKNSPNGLPSGWTAINA